MGSPARVNPYLGGRGAWPRRGTLPRTTSGRVYFKWSRDMPRHDYVRQKIIVCAEIYGRLLAELPSWSPVSSAASSRVRRALANNTATDNEVTFLSNTATDNEVTFLSNRVTDNEVTFLSNDAHIWLLYISTDFWKQPLPPNKLSEYKFLACPL